MVEDFKKIPNSDFEINSDGILRNAETHELKEAKKGETADYPSFNFNNNSYACHILVAKLFPEICGEWFKGCHVHHKDHNKWNYKASNLIVLTPKEHFKAHKGDKKNIKYYAYDENWNFIQSFDNSTEAEIFCLGDKHGINGVIRKKTYYYKGYNWLKD